MPRLALIFAALFFFIGAMAASPAHAQIMPDPHAGKSYVVRDAAGKIIQRLMPDGEQFGLIDSHAQKRIGWVKKLGPRLMFYNMLGRVTGIAKFELLPAGASISTVAIVRDPLGRLIGTLSRY